MTDPCIQAEEVKFKAMQKEFFSRFSIFAKDEMVFFPYSNLTRYKFDILVFAVISQNKYKNSHKTCDSHGYTVFLKILGIFEKFNPIESVGSI